MPSESRAHPVADNDASASLAGRRTPGARTKTGTVGDAGPRLSVRLDLGQGLRIGPGKVVLLEAIGRAGSISAAGRALGMSYRRAWELVAALNEGLGRPVVEAVTGGAGGGGARLTPLGETVVQTYRTIETEANATAASRLASLRMRRAG